MFKKILISMLLLSANNVICMESDFAEASTDKYVNKPSQDLQLTTNAQNTFFVFDLLPVELQELVISFAIANQIDLQQSAEIITQKVKNAIKNLTQVNKFFRNTIHSPRMEKFLKEYFEQAKEDFFAKSNFKYTPRAIQANNSFESIRNTNLLSKIEKFKKNNSLMLDNNNMNKTLLQAAEASDEDLVWFALCNGADINATNAGGHTALYSAAVDGNTNMAKFLLENNAKVNETTSIFKLTPIMAAVYYEHKDVVKLLLEYGADYKARDIRGDSALSRAKDKPDKPEIMALIKKQYRKNKKTKLN